MTNTLNNRILFSPFTAESYYLIKFKGIKNRYFA